jgi:hypothetical protein
MSGMSESLSGGKTENLRSKPKTRIEVGLVLPNGRIKSGGALGTY